MHGTTIAARGPTGCIGSIRGPCETAEIAVRHGRDRGMHWNGESTAIAAAITRSATPATTTAAAAAATTAAATAAATAATAAGATAAAAAAAAAAPAAGAARAAGVGDVCE